MGKKEFKVGDIIHPLGKDITLKVVEQMGCKGCYYKYDRRNCYKRYPMCCSVYRKDRKSVIFKQIYKGLDKDSLTEEEVKKLNTYFDKIKNDMETKKVIITVPKGYEIDKEKSTYTNIVFKKKEYVVRTWDDLVKYNKNNIPDGSMYIGPYSNIIPVNNLRRFNKCDLNAFIDEKHAKSALAMAQISQLMVYYGGAITDKEWNDEKIDKYTIMRLNNVITTNVWVDTYYFLAFHTSVQRDNFLKYNEQLVKDYLMIE